MANLPVQLLDVLRCPVTGSKLSQDGATLVADEPGPDGQTPTYRIDEGIPVLLSAELLRGTPHGS